MSDFVNALDEFVRKYVLEHPELTVIEMVGATETVKLAIFNANTRNMEAEPVGKQD